MRTTRRWMAVGAGALLAIVALASMLPSGDAGAESPLATLTPTPTGTHEAPEWSGEASESRLALRTFSGGTVEEMAAAAAAAGFRSVFATHDGQFVGYIVGAPDFANHPFERLFGGGIRPHTAFAVVIGADVLPVTAEEVLRVVLDHGYTVQRTDEVRDCDRTDAVPGVRYETSDGGAFYLWTYRAPTSYPPDDWYTDFPSTALHRRTFECNYPPSRIYASANLVLIVPVEETSHAALFAGETVRYLGGDAGSTPPRSPADDGQIVIPLPPSGTPFGGAHLLRALDADELAFLPYEQLDCHGDMERVHQYAGPLGGEGQIGEFELWVYQDIATLEAEWEPGADGTLGQPGVHRYRSPQCDSDRGSVYRNANLLLLLEEWAWTDDPTTRQRVIEAFLGLQP